MFLHAITASRTDNRPAGRKWNLLLLLSWSLLLGMVPVSAAPAMSDAEIWDACWSGDHTARLRAINYPDPIHLVIHNISRDDWQICVFDNLEPYTLFKGLLRQNHSISFSACANGRGRGSVTVMNAAGSMWHFQGTGDRVITIKK